jgi:uncharacterized membrane protein
MRTKASLRGHPIHPMLVVFPLALFTTGLATLIVYMSVGLPFWFHVSYLAMIAGGAGGVLAAVFGAIDLIYLPRDTRAKTVGVFHGGAAVIATALFLGAGFSMRGAWTNEAVQAGFSVALPLVLSIAGFSILMLTGMLGWQLIGAHHVGVSPVPGHAGRIDLAGPLRHPGRDSTRRPPEVGAHT